MLSRLRGYALSKGIKDRSVTEPFNQGYHGTRVQDENCRGYAHKSAKARFSDRKDTSESRKQNKALAPKVEIAKLASEVVSLTQATEESVASAAARTSKIEEAHMGFAGLAASIASKVEATEKSVVATQASVSSLASDVEAMQATVAAEMAQAKVAAEAPRPAVRHMIHRAIEAAFADRNGNGGLRD